ncbi:MAG: hypothetical protein WDM78_04115 [Puia sp.]
MQDTGIKYQINIHDHPVWVKAYYLAPETFNGGATFPFEHGLNGERLCFPGLSAIGYMMQNLATKVAQFILLGVGGAKLVDQLNFKPELYHLNEAHGISAAFLSVPEVQ